MAPRQRGPLASGTTTDGVAPPGRRRRIRLPNELQFGHPLANRNALQHLGWRERELAPTFLC